MPRDTGFVSPTFLFFTNFAMGVVLSTITLLGIIFYAVRQIRRAEETAERERERSETLLANILPPQVAERLKDSPGSEIADGFPEASVLFADMAGFSALASDITPADLVRFLNGVYTKLDGLVERHGLEKIKTTGDAYMVVSGVPNSLPITLARSPTWRLRSVMHSQTWSIPRAVRSRFASASLPDRWWQVLSARVSFFTTCGAMLLTQHRGWNRPVRLVKSR